MVLNQTQCFDHGVPGRKAISLVVMGAVMERARENRLKIPFRE
jgi:hypothetical protein